MRISEVPNLDQAVNVWRGWERMAKREISVSSKDDSLEMAEDEERTMDREDYVAKSAIAKMVRNQERRKGRERAGRGGNGRPSSRHSLSLMLPMSLISASSSSSSFPPVLLAASLVAYRCTYSACHVSEPAETPGQTKLVPFTLCSYSFGWRMSSAAASPFSGSLGLGYRNNCGKNTSKMFIISMTWVVR